LWAQHSKHCTNTKAQNRQTDEMRIYLPTALAKSISVLATD